MSSSWSFPAQAEPSWANPSLGHFNFRAETELTIPTIWQKITNFYSYLRTTIKFPNLRQGLFHYYNQFQDRFQSFSLKRFIKKMKSKFLLAYPPFIYFELNERRSRAKPSQKTFSLSYGLSQLSSDSSLITT